MKKDKKYDIGIMGVWYGQNYGSILTYYSLCKKLEKMGNSVLMIECPISKKHFETQQSSHSRVFANSHYNISEFLPFNKLKNLNKMCNTFILGSDQVFNPGIYRGFKTSLFLSFANNDKKLIAYAASFGHHFKLHTLERIKLKHYFSRFDAISVRERSGLEILNEDLDINDASQVIDPIFLSGKDLYEDLINEIEPIDEKNHILNYILDPKDNKRELMIEVSKRLNKPFVNVLDGFSNRFEDNKKLLNLDNTKDYPTVQEVLAYYKNSDFVITDSFHGTCLAIIFKKPFISIANNRRGVTRFESLLKRLKLIDRLIYDNFELNKINLDKLLTPIDYESVYEILNEDIENSENWLKESLKKPIKTRRFSLKNPIYNIYFNSGMQYHWIFPFVQYCRCDLFSKITRGNKKEHYIKKKESFFDDYKSKFGVKK